ncbi:uncharacterized protein IL334_007160 [Kwoniella shivajii]|uniref:Ricin B lectin domain-containing protein n=1 Tax=Kwoniella shivajii TaxID=564305 RepID=A0ABZ1D7X7_9TREE|nr:hypothetical protein IL334_007160 [Kwoniella shivajii]
MFSLTAILPFLAVTLALPADDTNNKPSVGKIQVYSSDAKSPKCLSAQYPNDDVHSTPDTTLDIVKCDQATEWTIDENSSGNIVLAGTSWAISSVQRKDDTHGATQNDIKLETLDTSSEAQRWTYSPDKDGQVTFKSEIKYSDETYCLTQNLLDNEIWAFSCQVQDPAIAGAVNNGK